MYIYEILEQRCYEKGLNVDELSIDELINEGGEAIFDFPYEMHNNEYKKVFQEKFFLRNFEKQIGYETVFGFKRSLRSKLYELMPKYNRLYELDEKKIDFFIGQQYKEELTKTTDGTEDSKLKDITSKDLSSDKDSRTENTANMTSGSNLESCEKTSDEGTTISDEERLSNDSSKGKNTEINKDLPENSAADSIKFASSTSHNDSSDSSTSSNVSSNNTTTKNKSSHGSKKATAEFQDSKDSSSTKEDQRLMEDVDRHVDNFTKRTNLEEYLLTRTNNNADGMIERIVSYVNNIQDTDWLLLNELDCLFSRIWGW